jgi:hypothetical protein
LIERSDILAWRDLRAGIFYQSKKISVIVSSDGGGTSDVRIKALMPFLQKYIPGNPPHRRVS